jgi:DNA-binding NarL/FixJ family response regulator
VTEPERPLSDKPTLVMAEDSVLIEISLRRLLEPHFNIVAAVTDGAAAISAAEQYHPSVMLIDISLPVVRGLEAARKIHALDSEIKILIVSNYADRECVKEARNLGASGYVLKTRAARELVPAIQTALAGGFYQPEVLF